MTPIDALERYLAVRCHWEQPGYDFHKYRGRVNVTQAAFNRRNDRRIFAAACTTNNIEDWTDLLVITIVDQNKMPFVGDLLDGDRLARARKWRERRLNPVDAFKHDINVLKVRFAGDCVALLKIKPPTSALLRFYYQKLIWPDTLVHLDRILKFIKIYDKKLKTDPLWSDLSHSLQRFAAFVPELPDNVAEDVLFSAFPASLT